MISEINAQPEFWLKVYSLIGLSVLLLQMLTQRMLGEHLTKPLKAFLGVLIILELVAIVIHILMSIGFVLSLNGILIINVFLHFYLIGKIVKYEK